MENKEQKERIPVRLNTGGIYPMYAYKTEYSEKGEYKLFKTRFTVHLGSRFSAWLTKTIFLKDTAQLKEELNYLLKFLAPDLLEKAYKVKTVKEYAELLSADINRELLSQAEQKKRPLLFGKVRKKKGQNYVDFEDYIPQTGDFRVSYLAFPEDVGSLYFSEWEYQNCDVPFEYNPSTKENGKKPEDEVFTTNSSNFDDLPF